jgi:homogentisate phytyltransferase / homogentisate geranylgeranyltransferase
MGLAALTAGYLGMAVLGPLMVPEAQPWVLAGGHLVALAALWGWALASDLRDQEGLTRFYMRVWLLFFLEYALMPAAVLAG